MFDPAQRGARVLRRGALTVAHCPDGRTLLWLSTPERGGAWLELRPSDRAWLMATLATTLRPEGGADCPDLD